MEDHVRILGIIYIIYGILLLLIAGALFVTMAGIGAMSGDRDAAWIVGGIGFLVASIVAILSIPTIITGVGLRRFRPWARILGIILAVLKLFSFPVGTAIGVYALWVLLNERTQPLFTQRSVA